MSLVILAIPVTRLKVRLQLYKGQAWSVAEHCILDTLVRESYTVDALLSGFRLPRALVEEALMRLMRVGWVEPLITREGIAMFRATPIGSAAAARRDELPSALRPAERERWQVFERITGHVFRLNDLHDIRRRDLSNQPHSSHIHMIPALLEEGQYRPDELAETALEEDEWLVAVEATGEFAPDRLALVEVVEGRVRGLPPARELDDLRTKILEAARETPGTRAESRSRAPSNRAARTYRKHPVHFRPDDLIVSGVKHRETLREVLEKARTRIIIHSTFLSERRFFEWWGLMAKAMDERQVRIDILWGQEGKEDPDGTVQRSPAERAVQCLLKHPELIARQERLRIHPVSTRSHAKIIVADPNDADVWEAIIGSCNWLDTPFEKGEASVRLRDAGIVGDVLKSLMSMVHDGGRWTELMTELQHMVERLRIRDLPGTPNGEAWLVSDDGHNAQLLRARDHVRRKLLLVSHRLGAYYDCGALLPLAAACQGSPSIDARFWYSRNDQKKDRTSAQLEREARELGIHLGLVHKPGLHAKVLAWDENDVVVTSQNWMSRDPGFYNMLSELGVAVTAPGAARNLMQLIDGQLR